MENRNLTQIIKDIAKPVGSLIIAGSIVTGMNGCTGKNTEIPNFEKNVPIEEIIYERSYESGSIKKNSNYNQNPCKTSYFYDKTEIMPMIYTNGLISTKCDFDNDNNVDLVQESYFDKNHENLTKNLGLIKTVFYDEQGNEVLSLVDLSGDDTLDNVIFNKYDSSNNKILTAYYKPKTSSLKFEQVEGYNFNRDEINTLILESMSKNSKKLNKKNGK